MAGPPLNITNNKVNYLVNKNALGLSRAFFIAYKRKLLYNLSRLY